MENCIVYALWLVVGATVIVKHFGYYRLHVMHLNRKKFETLMNLLPLLTLNISLFFIVIYKFIVDSVLLVEVSLLTVNTVLIWYYTRKHWTNISYYYRSIMSIK